MTQEKSDIINIAKAIGITLMVIGHAGCPSWLHDFIYVFHMPLFFFLSGYCLKESHVSQPWQFSVRRLKQNHHSSTLPNMVDMDTLCAYWHGGFHPTCHSRKIRQDNTPFHSLMRT